MPVLLSITRFVAARIENSQKRAAARSERRGRRLATSPSRPPMFEQLEPRMLLSGVPAGFVEVGSYTIGTGSATPVMTADLAPGVKHIAVASGTFKVGAPSSHIADAEYHQKGPNKAWNDLTTLKNHNTDMGLDDASGRLGHWGPHEADAEYEQEFTPTTSDPLALFYHDVEGQGPNGAGSTWYDDNVGTLTVALWREAPTVSITAVRDGAEMVGVDGNPTSAVFMISRGGVPEGDLGVRVVSSDGGAVRGYDFDFELTSVVIPDGESFVLAEVPVVQDCEHEGGENFSISILASLDGAYKVSPEAGVVVLSVADDDAAPADGEGEEGGMDAATRALADTLSNEALHTELLDAWKATNPDGAGEAQKQEHGGRIFLDGDGHVQFERAETGAAGEREITIPLQESDLGSYHVHPDQYSSDPETENHHLRMIMDVQDLSDYRIPSWKDSRQARTRCQPVIVLDRFYLYLVQTDGRYYRLPHPGVNSDAPTTPIDGPHDAMDPPEDEGEGH